MERLKEKRLFPWEDIDRSGAMEKMIGRHMKLSIVLPAYQERDSIVPLIAEIKKYLVPYTKEIIVVDDYSADGTVEALSKAFPDDREVTVLVRYRNRGLANSIREGIEKSSGDVIVVMDTDFNHQPSYLTFMIEAMRHFDCVMASRFVYGGKMDTRARHLLSWIFNVFVRVMTGGQITDNLYGFFAIRKKTLESVDFNDVFTGYGDYFIRLVHDLEQKQIAILQFPAVNGTRRTGKRNRAFLKTFLQYFLATVRLSLKKKGNAQ